MDGVKISDKQMAEIKQTFAEYDKKKDGQLKVGDIGAAMKAFGHTIAPDWLEKLEDMIDQEGTGFIDEAEFILIVKKKMQDDEDERELKDMFRILAKKKNEVNVSELRWILKNLGDDLTEDDIDNMIEDVDTDGSGWVDYDEFYKLMMSD